MRENLSANSQWQCSTKVLQEPIQITEITLWLREILHKYLTARSKGLQRFWLHPRDRYPVVTQTYNNCAETHLGGGAMSPFVSLLSANARAHDDPTVIGSVHVAFRKGPRSFCPHCSDRCRALMFMRRNSPLWQCCEHFNNVLSSFWLPWLDQLNSVVITWRGLIGTSRTCKVAIYNYMSILVLWTTLENELVDANRGIESRTCYQECGCHLLYSW